jgi:hypothetical protein
MRTHCKGRHSPESCPERWIFIHPFDRAKCRTRRCERESSGLRSHLISVARLPLRYGNSIAMTGRLRDDEKARIFTTAIEDLMRRLCGYREAGEGREAVRFAIELDSELASENIEELRRPLMHVALLRAARWHALFDHAKRVCTMKMPAVTSMRADGARPYIVFGIAAADSFHSRRPP